MKGIFNVEGPLFTVLSKAFDMIVINLVWIITWMPFVGLGALGFYCYQNSMPTALVILIFILAAAAFVVFIPSFTALYYSVVKSIRHSRSYPVKEYISSFIDNFSMGSKISIIYLIMGGILIYDFPFAFAMVQQGDNRGSFLVGLFIMLSFLMMAVLTFVCPIISRFRISRLSDVIKFSFGLSLRHLWVTLLSILLWAFVIFMIYITGFFCIFFGISCGVLVQSFMMEKVLRKYMEKSKEENKVLDADGNEVKADEWYLE